MKPIDEVAPGMAYAGQPLEGVATAGQPDREQLELLAEAGYKTVIDLRTFEEPRGFDEPEIVGQAGMEYVSIPVGHEDIDDGTFDRFRERMADQGRRPVLVHCSSANRVGALPRARRGQERGRGVRDCLAGRTAKRRAQASGAPIRDAVGSSIHDGAATATRLRCFGSEVVPPYPSRTLGDEIGRSLATPNFGELRHGEVPRIHILRGSMNRADLWIGGPAQVGLCPG
jgi:protein tyrosine phosphatase (PTP) superfamily phosphohydrolase (DUF442 family)